LTGETEEVRSAAAIGITDTLKRAAVAAGMKSLSGGTCSGAAAPDLDVDSVIREF
jgi:hypothetical protein